MKKSIIYIVVVLLATLLMSCTSTEYINKPVIPQITFPVFPELEGEIRNTDGTITVPAEWIIQIAEYKIRIEETEKNFNDIKPLYDGSD